MSRYSKEPPPPRLNYRERWAEPPGARAPAPRAALGEGEEPPDHTKDAYTPRAHPFRPARPFQPARPGNRKLVVTRDGVISLDHAILGAIAKLEVRAKKNNLPRPKITAPMLIDAACPDVMIECQRVDGDTVDSPLIVKSLRAFGRKARVQLVTRSLERLYDQGALVLVSARTQTGTRTREIRAFQLRDS